MELWRELERSGREIKGEYGTKGATGVWDCCDGRKGVAEAIEHETLVREAGESRPSLSSISELKNPSQVPGQSRRNSRRRQRAAF